MVTSTYVLALDIGGTNPRMAMVQCAGHNQYALDGQPIPICGDKVDLYQSVASFLAKSAVRQIVPECCVVGIAGEIIGNKVNHTANAQYLLDGDEMTERIGLKTVLLNDFEVIAHGIGCYDLNRDVHCFSQGKPISAQTRLVQLPLNNDFAMPQTASNKAVVGPGTGLGVAYMKPGLPINGNGKDNGMAKCHAARSDWASPLRVFPSEAGHAPFACPSKYIAFGRFLETAYQCDRLGMEAFVNGAAIGHLVDFLLQNPGFDSNATNAWVLEPKVQALYQNTLSDDQPAFITAHATQNAVFEKAMTLYFEFLAIAASTVALHGLCFGGLFLAGGILPKIKQLLLSSSFMAQFVLNWQKSDLLSKIPVYLVLDYDISFYGCAKAAGF